MRALSIRQPYAELILRGIKTVEYRTQPTRVIGERFWIYASKGVVTKSHGPAKAKPWSRDLSMPGPAGSNIAPPRWMLELAEQIGMVEPGALLPTGVIVGSAIIDRVTRMDDDAYFRWHLVNVERVEHLRKPTGHPQPVWFNPF
jgi:hypothetical protein